MKFGCRSELEFSCCNCCSCNMQVTSTTAASRTPAPHGSNKNAVFFARGGFRSLPLRLMYAQNSSIHFAFHAQNKLAWWSSNIPRPQSWLTFFISQDSCGVGMVADLTGVVFRRWENHTTLSGLLGIWWGLIMISPLNGKVPSGYWTVCYGNHGPLIDDKPWWFTYKHGDFP